MTTDVLTGGTAAAQLHHSEALRKAISTIIGEVEAAAATITEARPGDRALAAAYRGNLDAFAAGKGRGAALAYIGSGVGNGPLVELSDASVKWDMICGIGVHAFGHSDSDLLATALRAAMSDTVMQGNLQFNQETIDLTNLLVQVASRGSRLEHCFLINSGAMANESALKVCFQKRTPASRVLATEGSFAGRSTTMAQIGESPAGRVGLPLNVPVDFIPYYDPDRPAESTADAIEALRKNIERYPGAHACLYTELLQGEGGFREAPREFFVSLFEICREHNIAIWIDEIQTFGRTEQMFHFQQKDLGQYADVVTLGKMSQVCACLYTKEFNPKPGLLSATFVGSTVGLAVGRRLIERLRDGEYYGGTGRNARLQKAFRAHAKRLVDDHPDWFPPLEHPRSGKRKHLGVFGGVGGMMRLTPFAGEKDMITKCVRTLFEEGLVSFYCGHDPYHLRFLAPIGVMEESQFEPVFEIIERGLNRVAAES